MRSGTITRARASAILAGSALACALPAPIRAQAPGSIRLGILAVETAAEGYCAKDMGYFEKAGLAVDLQIMSSGIAIAAAMPNSVDVGVIAVDALAGIHSKNVPLIAIAPAAEYVSPATERTAALVLPASSTIQQAKELNGKTIAVSPLKGIQETATRAWIDHHGGDSATVKFVEIPTAADAAALDSGRVDAAWVTEPLLSVVGKDHRILGYGMDGIAKHFISTTWFTTPQWAKDHPDLVSRFAAAMYDTAVWANKNPAKSGEILAKYTKIDPAVVATMARIRYPEQFTPALMQPLIDVSAKYNGFSPFPAQELMYTPPR